MLAVNLVTLMVLCFQYPASLADLNASGVTGRRHLQSLAEWGDQGHCAQHYSLADIQEDVALSSPQRWLASHNYYRGCHGVPELSWDPKLLSYAKAWVEEILQHCESGPDLENWVQAGGTGTTRPHDPNTFTTEVPQQGENIDARQYDSIHDPQWQSVQDWYQEIQSCPGQGKQPGCGGVLNHYTAMIWKDARRMACYVGVRGDLRVVSCRYSAAAGGNGEGCEVPNSLGPPGSKGCEMGAGTADGLPEVPPVVHSCPSLGAPSPAPESGPAKPAPVSQPPAPRQPEAELPWVTKMSDATCIRPHQLGKCERCLHDVQCGDGRYCCPFMKKCVKNGGETCYTPIAYCQPPCMDGKPLDQCHCSPKGTEDVFPGEWQRPTCQDGEEPIIITTTPKPTAPPAELNYKGIKDKAQWNRLLEFVRSKAEPWKIESWCASLSAYSVSDTSDEFISGTAHIIVEFNDLLDERTRNFEFEHVVPKLDPISTQAQLRELCKGQGGLSQRWSVLPAHARLRPLAAFPLALASLAAAAAVAAAVLAWRRQRQGDVEEDGEELYDRSEDALL